MIKLIKKCISIINLALQKKYSPFLYLISLAEQNNVNDFEKYLSEHDFENSFLENILAQLMHEKKLSNQQEKIKFLNCVLDAIQDKEDAILNNKSLNNYYDNISKNYNLSTKTMFKKDNVNLLRLSVAGKEFEVSKFLISKIKDFDSEDLDKAKNVFDVLDSICLSLAQDKDKQFQSDFDAFEQMLYDLSWKGYSLSNLVKLGLDKEKTFYFVVVFDKIKDVVEKVETDVKVNKEIQLFERSFVPQEVKKKIKI